MFNLEEYLPDSPFTEKSIIVVPFSLIASFKIKIIDLYNLFNLDLGIKFEIEFGCIPLT